MTVSPTATPTPPLPLRRRPSAQVRGPGDAEEHILQDVERAAGLVAGGPGPAGEGLYVEPGYVFARGAVYTQPAVPLKCSVLTCHSGITLTDWWWWPRCIRARTRACHVGAAQKGVAAALPRRSSQ